MGDVLVGLFKALLGTLGAAATGYLLKDAWRELRPSAFAERKHLRTQVKNQRAQIVSQHKQLIHLQTIFAVGILAVSFVGMMALLVFLGRRA